MERIVKAELLDHLHHEDPRAIRSRRDLAHLDLFLGNSRWILNSLRREASRDTRIVELGAGAGHLCRGISGVRPGSTITGLDLLGRPPGLPESIRWVSGDFMQTLQTVDAQVCCGSLILHHLEEKPLRQLGQEFRRFPILLFSEPHRGKFPLCMAGLASPLVGEVTRHDMPASIRAGFRKGELQHLLGLDLQDWEIREQNTLRGALRFAATRR